LLGLDNLLGSIIWQINKNEGFQLCGAVF